MSRVLLLAFVAALALFPTAAGAGASGVVVSQIYGGGGNAGATFRNDYVELFNAGAGVVDLSGWTVQYATAAGTTWQTTALSGTIAPGRYYLVQLASNADVGAVLPSPDATGTSNLGGTSGKIALVRGAAALTCGASAGSCSADPLVDDLVGYGSASDFEALQRRPRGQPAHLGAEVVAPYPQRGGDAHASELRLPGALVRGHTFLGANRLRERRPRRGFRPLRVPRPSLAQLRHVHVRR